MTHPKRLDHSGKPILHADKCCVECRHFDLDVGLTGYSVDTPGSDFRMECMKKHWRFETDCSEEHYRGCILSAKTCEDFEERGN